MPLKIDFLINYVSMEEVYKKIRRVNPRIAVRTTDILNKIQKIMEIFFLLYLCFFQWFHKNYNFSSILKHANIALVIKKEIVALNKIITQLSILPVTLKIFGILIVKQVAPFMILPILKFQCGSKKGFLIQVCFLRIFQNRNLH